MIVSHSNKFVFFRVPKTGSSTAGFYINISRVPLEDDYTSPMPAFDIGDPVQLKERDPKLRETIHASPAIALRHKLITMKQLREYDAFGFVRDPYARLLSGLLHAMGSRTTPDMIATLIKTKNYGEIYKLYDVLVRRQVDYFFVDGEQVLTPLSMTHYEDNLRMLISKYGGIHFPVIASLNGRQLTKDRYPTEEWMTPVFKDFVGENYHEDIEFFNKVKAGGK